MNWKKYQIIGVFIVLCASFFGCDSESLQDVHTDPDERVRFILDGLEEAPGYSDTVELRSAVWNQKQLDITVAYSGGCQEHSFTLYSAAVNILIYPPQIGVMLSHESNNDSCEAYITETISVDVSPLVDRMNGPFWVNLGVLGSFSGEVIPLEYK